MVETTLSRIGNSMGVLLPKALRKEASFDADKPLRMSSPREGVIVITAVQDDRDRLAVLEDAQSQIERRSKKTKAWPKNMDADDLLRKGKEDIADELLPV